MHSCGTIYPKHSQQGHFMNHDLHVFHCDVLKNLTVVHIPHSLVVPDLGRQQYCTQHNTLPVGRHNINFSIVEQSLQVNLQYAMSKKSECMKYQYMYIYMYTHNVAKNIFGNNLRNRLVVCHLKW